MNKEKIELGDIRINKDTCKPEMCTEVVYGADGIEITWADYDTALFESCYGQCGYSEDIYPLSVFRDTFIAAQKQKAKLKNRIKIRYAYIGSPTNLRSDPTYYESLRFKVLTIEDLEQRSNKITLEELITDGNEALIEVLGRDRCTGRVNMAGDEVYENDRIRCYDDSGGYIDEIVDLTTNFISYFPTEDCKIIGTVYDKKGDI